MKIGKHYLRMAFQSNDTSCLRSIHLYLNQIYYLMLYGEDKSRFITDANSKKLRLVEREWITYEEAQCTRWYPIHKKIYEIRDVKEELKEHAAYQHSFVHYLEKNADINDMRWFFLNESVLNLEFFDYLALGLVGVSDQARAEIMRNCWDESGQGDVDQFHTTLFRKFLSDLKLNYNRDLIIANMPWQGLAGINLFNYYAIHSYNKMKFYGLMAATELLDPPHYQRIIRGVKRVFGDNKIDLNYYAEHETVDLFHASGWLNRVVIPELTLHPEKTHEFWMGFYMRLESVKRYYDFFEKSMIAEQAA